jgi:hypothetical protein
VGAKRISRPHPQPIREYPPPPPPKKQKHCNAGRGNGSEGCDPGNSSTAADGSAGQNMGGDEGGPISGGTGVE